jgi:hypothetical protein
MVYIALFVVSLFVFIYFYFLGLLFKVFFLFLNFIAIVFYGLKILIRHLKAAHPKESLIWEKTIKGIDNNDYSSSLKIIKAISSFKNKKIREEEEKKDNLTRREQGFFYFC